MADDVCKGQLRRHRMGQTVVLVRVLRINKRGMVTLEVISGPTASLGARWQWGRGEVAELTEAYRGSR